MVIFRSDWKMSDVIHQNHHLLPVINRFDIRLGFGDRSIEEVCRLHQADTNFFLAIINTFHNEDYFPEKQLLSFSPVLIVSYLKKTHRYYLDYNIPALEQLLDLFLSGYRGDVKDLKIIRTFYSKYKQELTAHIRHEEEQVFPYVLAVVKASESASDLDNGFEIYSIKNFEKEHSNVDEKLFDLKNIIIKYMNPVYDDNHCNSFLFSLCELEKDLKDHARIEDKILVSKVLELERLVKNG
jgi:regulator of cell morphogenesis and NO signaling